jgi:hypothetical protein
MFVQGILDGLQEDAVVGRYSKWGSWGLMEYHGQPVGEAPKYQAVLEFLEKNPIWW